MAASIAALALFFPHGAAGVEIGFAVIRSEAPLRIGPPLKFVSSERLAVRIRRLEPRVSGDVVVTALVDADGDGVIDDLAGREAWRRSLESLRSQNLSNRQDEVVALLPGPAGEPFDQLELTLRGPDDEVFAGPSHLTPDPEALAARTASVFSEFGDGAWRALRRLVRIAEVVRSDEQARQVFVVAASGAGASEPTSLAVADAPPRALAIAPGGERVAWIAESDGTDAIWLVDAAGDGSPRRIRLGGDLPGGLTFADPDTVVSARDNTILLVATADGGAQRAVATNFARVFEVQRASSRDGQTRVWLRAATIEGGLPRPHRLDIDPIGRVSAVPLFELAAHDLLPRMTGAGRACFAVPDGARTTIECVGPTSTSPEMVARCTGAGLVRAAATTERLAFVAQSCP